MRVLEKSRYVPSSYEPYLQYEPLGIEIFIDKARNCALGFSGRRNKSDFNYRFSNAEKMEQYCADFVAKNIKHAEIKKQEKADRLEKNRNVKVSVGDIFVSSWGYEQSNVDYYQVVGVSGQMIDVRKIASAREGNGLPDQGQCVPVPNNFVGDKVMRKRVRGLGEYGVAFRVASYANAYLKKPVAVVAGVPMYESDFWSAYY